jgi:soluble lytic murein transglycosylase-like protein
VIRFRGHGAEWWANKYLQLQRRTRHAIRRDVNYALRLAAASYPVPLAELRAVARCESGLDPFNVNPSSRASGLFQFLPSTWAGRWGGYRYHQLGFSVFDPVANALAAAQVVTRDGSWRQWVCRP